MSRQLCKDQKSVQRFQREVETIARLSHPNIVLAYDADEADIGHFLVMEFVDGCDLESIVRTNGPLSIRDAVSCIIQAAQGLEYAHAQSIIHRDIKPANLLRDALGMVKITDLGLARLSQTAQADGDTGLTSTGTVVGTPDYMSTEQAMGSDIIDHRTDIYSLGCTLYYLLVGMPPYHANSVMGILLKHRDGPIPDLRVILPGIPPALDTVFRKMVAKDPAARYQTMAEVVAALMTVPVQSTQAISAVTGEFAPGAPTADEVKSVPNTIAQTAALSQAITPNVRQQPVSGQRIALLVESSRTQASIIRKYLEELKFEPILASSLSEAVDLVSKHKPDIVLSAMHLKDGTGVELDQKIAATVRDAAIPFVLIASQDESKHADTLNRFGRATTLLKPFTAEKLAETLSEVLERKLPPITRSEHLSANRSSFHVLIVDDSVAARMHEKRVLQELGFTQISEVMDGAQAVAAVAQRKYDLIVTDYNMPLMDGAALIGYLRQNPATASIPIIMVTTETEVAKLEAVRKLGVADIVPKGFPIGTIKAVIEKLFGT